MTYTRLRTRGPTYRMSELLGTKYNQGSPHCPGDNWTAPTTCLFPSGRIMQEEYCLDEVHQGPPYTCGGPLFLKRKRAEYIDSDDFDIKRYRYRYTGRLAVGTPMPSAMGNTYYAYAPTASTFGAEAWNKFRPVRPRVDMGQWTGELRDLPQNPWPWRAATLRNTVRRFKNLGGQYLNYVFGWKPFISDLIKTYELSCKIENHIAYVRQNNGKWMTKAGTLRDLTTTTTENGGLIHTPSLVTYMYWDSSYSKSQVTKTTSDKIWFKARWKYYIPGLSVDSAKDVWSSKLLQKLYGFELTPSLAWELIPFTWLEDWVCNVGDVVSNFSNSMYDNLVAKYAYIMRHRQMVWTYEQTFGLKADDPHCIGGNLIYETPYRAGSANVRAKFTVECKERAAASPFGFGGGGILEQGLSDRQTAILLALGISKLA